MKRGSKKPAVPPFKPADGIFTKLSERRVLVLGAGVSGQAAVNALLKRKAKVSLVALEQNEAVRALEAKGCEYLGAGEAGVRKWLSRMPVIAPTKCLAVLSPGIPVDAPEVLPLRIAGVPITGELALGAQLFQGDMIAITGSKGKSSVVKFLQDTLRLAGHSAVACGNYGLPLCAVADMEDPPEYAVVECSSFQLETVGNEFVPKYAAILNLTEDHLDRHKNLENYAKAKLRIFPLYTTTFAKKRGVKFYDPHNHRRTFMTGNLLENSDLLRYFWGEVEYDSDRPYPGDFCAPMTYFGAPGEVDLTWSYEDGFVYPTFDPSDRYDFRGSYFDNDVLSPAAALCVAILEAEFFPKTIIEKGFREFEPLPHRMQKVAKTKGITWINNSKATSLDALYASLKMAPKPIRLLCGGRLKQDLDLYAEILVDNGVKKVYTFGESAQAMKEAWSDGVTVEAFSTLAEACSAVIKELENWSGGSVLLAPGGSSFDQYHHFEERGDEFAKIARDYEASLH